MRLIGTALLLFTLAASADPAAAQTGPPPVAGRLAGAMLLGEAPLAASDLPPDMPSSDRLRLLAYIERAGAAQAGGWLGRQVLAAIERPGSEQLAADLAKTHAAASPGGPAAEAAWAEGALRDGTNRPAAPFLYAFLAARYRLQIEQAPDVRAELERLAKKYRTMLDRVRHADDTLFAILAEDLDGRPALSPGATRHPRQYLPDT